MACPFCRFLAWLQHKLDVRAQKKAAQARDAARTQKIERNRSASLLRRYGYKPPPMSPPPPGDTENLETLRARIPPRSTIVREEDVFRPPPPTDTVEEACRAAAYAVEWPICLAITEPERELVAARAVQAIATAVSTSPSYPVFVAAVTMAESKALIDSEAPYHKVPPGISARRRLNALDVAVEAGMAVYAENKAWPGGDDTTNNGFDTPDHSDSVSVSALVANSAHTTQSSGSSISLLRQRPASRLPRPIKTSFRSRG